MFRSLPDRHPMQLRVGDYVSNHGQTVVKIDRKRGGAFFVTYENNATWDAAKPNIPNVDILRPLERFREGGSLLKDNS